MAPAARLLAFANFVLFGKDKVMIGKKGLAWPWPPPRGVRILSAGQGGGFGKKRVAGQMADPGLSIYHLILPGKTWEICPGSNFQERY